MTDSTGNTAHTEAQQALDELVGAIARKRRIQAEFRAALKGVRLAKERLDKAIAEAAKETADDAGRGPNMRVVSLIEDLLGENSTPASLGWALTVRGLGPAEVKGDGLALFGELLHVEPNGPDGHFWYSLVESDADHGIIAQWIERKSREARR